MFSFKARLFNNTLGVWKQNTLFKLTVCDIAAAFAHLFQMAVGMKNLNYALKGENGIWPDSNSIH